MGQQHNSHVANDTDDTIKIVLSDNTNNNSSQIIHKKGYCCIPTVKGKVTVSVFKKDSEGNFEGRATATYTNKSDRSFIVKNVNGGHINIGRTKYGKIWEEETGIQ